jgi:predicted molibdopterin-dependent oxidoreductase YjgC
VVGLVGLASLTDDPRLAEGVAAWLRSKGARILPLARRPNTFGALDMGVAPDLLPGRVSVTSESPWEGVPAVAGKDTRGILEALVSGEVRALVMMGADPVADVPDSALATTALERAEFVVAIDMFATASTAHADVVLPALGFAEKEGTVTNLEGRVQKVNALVPGAGQSRADWSILDDIARRMGTPLGWSSASEVAKEIAAVAPAYAAVTWDTLDWDHPHGVVVPTADGSQPLTYLPAPVSVPSASAEMVLHSARTLYDDGVLMRYGLSLHRLAPGAAAFLHPDDARRLGVSVGDRVRVETGSASVELAVVLDDSLTHGAVYVPFNQPGCPGLGSVPAVTVSAI